MIKQLLTCLRLDVVSWEDILIQGFVDSFVVIAVRPYVYLDLKSTLWNLWLDINSTLQDWTIQV